MPLGVNTFKVGALSTNCYILTNDKKECLVIDPGDDGEYLSEKINSLDLKLKGIFATHGHFDHVLASGYLGNIFNLPLSIDKRDRFLINNMNKSASFWLKSKIKEIIPKVLDYKDNKNLLEYFGIKVLNTEGHTPGSVSLYCESENILFSGDVLFKGGLIGRYDFKYSNKMDLVKSVRKILKLRPITKVFPGHGESTFVKSEVNYLKNV